MAGISTILMAVGTVAAVAGSAVSANASMQAEAARKRQMGLESARQRREIIRQSLRARAASLTAGTASGANVQGASGLPGALGSITGRTASNINAVDQAETIGATIFKANEQQAWGQTLASFGNGLSSLGSQVGSVRPEMDRIGTYAAGSKG